MNIFRKLNIMNEKLYNIESKMNDIESLMLDAKMQHHRDVEIIEKQDKIIENLIKDKSDDESFECIVYVPYRGRPVVIKDGKVLSDDNMTSFSVDWSLGNTVSLIVRSE